MYACSGTSGTIGAPFRTFGYAMGKLFASDGPGKGTVRFHAGQQFDVGSGFAVPNPAPLTNNLNGPFLIERYESGGKPVINSTQYYTLLDLTYTSDVRIRDVNFIGTGTSTGTGGPDDPFEYGVTPGQNFLLLRSEMSGFYSAVAAGGPDEPVRTGNVIADCQIGQIGQSGTGYVGHYGITYYNAAQMAVLGCTLTDSHEHCLRTYVSKSVVGHCNFKRCAEGKHLLKFCGLWPALGGSHYCVISDNRFTQPKISPDGPVPEITAFGPENVDATSTQLVQDVIIERNYWSALPDEEHYAIVSSGASRVTVRNNVAVNCEVFIKPSSPVLNFSTWDQWNVMNNTWVFAYQNRYDCDFMAGGTDGLLTNLTVRDNIGYSLNPPSQGQSFSPDSVLKLPGTSLSSITEDHDLWYFPDANPGHFMNIGGLEVYYNWAGWLAEGKGTGNFATQPVFAQNPDLGGDGTWDTDDDLGYLRLQIGSPGLGVALFTHYVREDFEGHPRLTTGRDMGAYQGASQP